MAEKEKTGRSAVRLENEMAGEMKSTRRSREVLEPVKAVDSASDDDNSDASSDDASDEKEAVPSSKRRKMAEGEDDDDDDEKAKTDDADEHSDTAAQRQSKRKPSKSRIKRILPQHPPRSSLSPDASTPLPSMDSLVMMGAHSSLVSQASMMSPSQAYNMQMSGGQLKSPGAYKCGVCGKEFRVPSRYESHMMSHSKGKPFCCDVSIWEVILSKL